MTTIYGVYAPVLYGRHRESRIDYTAAVALGRSPLRWTVYRRVDYGDAYSLETISRHWTRTGAHRAAAHLAEETR